MPVVSKGKSGIVIGMLFVVVSPFVAYHEGVVPYTYADVNGTATLCAGETGLGVEWGMKTTMADCLARLDKRLALEWSRVEPCIQWPITRNQAAALLSWSYNVGATAACGSSLMRKLNAGQPFCADLSKWTYSQGRQLKGLVRRRADERKLCETP